MLWTHIRTANTVAYLHLHIQCVAVFLHFYFVVSMDICEQHFDNQFKIINYYYIRCNDINESVLHETTNEQQILWVCDVITNYYNWLFLLWNWYQLICVHLSTLVLIRKSPKIPIREYLHCHVTVKTVFVRDRSVWKLHTNNLRSSASRFWIIESKRTVASNDLTLYAEMLYLW